LQKRKNVLRLQLTKAKKKLSPKEKQKNQTKKKKKERKVNERDIYDMTGAGPSHRQRWGGKRGRTSYLTPAA